MARKQSASARARTEERAAGALSRRGFLAGAAQTAMGVAGGMLLGSAIAGMLTGGAHADENSGDASANQGGDEFDAGGDDFGGGDFDIGGDF